MNKFLISSLSIVVMGASLIACAPANRSKPNAAIAKTGTADQQQKQKAAADAAAAAKEVVSSAPVSSDFPITHVSSNLTRDNTSVIFTISLNGETSPLKIAATNLNIQPAPVAIEKDPKDPASLAVTTKYFQSGTSTCIPDTAAITAPASILDCSTVNLVLMVKGKTQPVQVNVDRTHSSNMHVDRIEGDSNGQQLSGTEMVEVEPAFSIKNDVSVNGGSKTTYQNFHVGSLNGTAPVTCGGKPCAAENAIDQNQTNIIRVQLLNGLGADKKGIQYFESSTPSRSVILNENGLVYLKLSAGKPNTPEMKSLFFVISPAIPSTYGKPIESRQAPAQQGANGQTSLPPAPPPQAQSGVGTAARPIAPPQKTDVELLSDAKKDLEAKTSAEVALKQKLDDLNDHGTPAEKIDLPATQAALTKATAERIASKANVDTLQKKVDTAATTAAAQAVRPPAAPAKPSASSTANSGSAVNPGQGAGGGAQSDGAVVDQEKVKLKQDNARMAAEIEALRAAPPVAVKKPLARTGNKPIPSSPAMKPLLEAQTAALKAQKAQKIISNKANSDLAALQAKKASDGTSVTDDAITAAQATATAEKAKLEADAVKVAVAKKAIDAQTAKEKTASHPTT